MNWLGELVQNEVTESDTLLDLGCGVMQATDGLICKYIVCCDIFLPYLDELKYRYSTIRLNLNELDKFPDNSYDVVICLDVLEHLDKELAIFVIENMKRICRRKAIVYTPRFFDSNTEAVDNAWGFGKNDYQKHLCLIEKPVLHSRGFKPSNDNEDGGTYGVYEKWS